MRRSFVVVAALSVAWRTPRVAADPGISGQGAAIVLLGAAVVDAVALTTFAVVDVTANPSSLAYGTTEAVVTAPLALVIGAGGAVALADGEVAGGGLALGVAGLEGYFAYDGIHRMVDQWPDRVATWSIVVGCADAVQLTTSAVFELARDDGPDRLGYVEAGVNLPFAAGLSYFAYGEARDGHTGPAIVLGGGALISALFTYRGIRTALEPDPWTPAPVTPKPAAVVILPTLVGDGRDVGLGFGASGRW